MGDGQGEATSDVEAQRRADQALAIVNSEAFMWLMVGANHQEAHLNALRPAYDRFRELGGGYGRRVGDE